MAHNSKYVTGKSRESKGQSASSAAAFIAILTVIIIMYILFLPPDIREEILNDGTGGTSGSGGSGTGTYTGKNIELFSQQIGRVDYINSNDKVYDLSSVRIFSPTSGQLIKATPSISVKNGLFDKETAETEIEFSVDKKSTQNVLLSFTVKKSVGPAVVSLNGRQIYSGTFETSNPKPIPFSVDELKTDNVLTFKSLDPGWAFWKTNTFTLENIQITGDVTDYTRSQSLQYFTISDAEKNNLESVRFYFTPGCQLNDVGTLDIELNNRMIYSSVADCGVRSSAAIDKGQILAGSNSIRFSTNKGSYLLDNMYFITTFTKAMYNTYFFDMDKDYFLTTTERATCGIVDGECPPGCSNTKDADCCFRQNGYWCALPTYNPNDRCVFYVDTGDCDICPTGYYNKYDDPHENCEGKCGDNTDGICPSDCPGQTKYYDADCCWQENPNYFYCQEAPLTGLSDKCKASVRPSDCGLCPSDYRNEDNDKPDACKVNTYEPTNYEDTLIDEYDVKFIVRFVDNTKRKRVDMNINGYKISIDTTQIEYTRIIDSYIREGTNTIEIIPKEDIDIAEITVELVRVQ